MKTPFLELTCTNGRQQLPEISTMVSSLISADSKQITGSLWK